MSELVYYFLHVLGAILLIAFTFQAFAAPAPEKKGRVMAITGICAVVVVVAGFGLLAKRGYSISAGWVIVKLVCWLGIAGISGMAFRRPEKAGFYTLITIVLAAAAVYAVYFKPF